MFRNVQLPVTEVRLVEDNEQSGGSLTPLLTTGLAKLHIENATVFGTVCILSKPAN